VLKFGNLLVAGLVTGSIYAVFAVCVAVWYRVSNILNLAVGDFAMAGALGVDNLTRVRQWPLPAAIAATLAVVAGFAYADDQVVLRLAQDGRHRHEGIVITYFPSRQHVPVLVAGARNAAISMVVRVFGLWSGRSVPVETRREVVTGGRTVNG
jgi:branched-subunit amino acid ABC-type transport system permease component